MQYVVGIFPHVITWKEIFGEPLWVGRRVGPQKHIGLSETATEVHSLRQLEYE